MKNVTDKIKNIDTQLEKYRKQIDDNNKNYIEEGVIADTMDSGGSGREPKKVQASTAMDRALRIQQEMFPFKTRSTDTAVESNPCSSNPNDLAALNKIKKLLETKINKLTKLKEKLKLQKDYENI